MADGSVATAIEAARLMLICGDPALEHRMAGPLAEICPVAPVIARLASGRPAMDVLRGSAFDIIAAELSALADIAGVIEEQVSRLARVAGGALILVLTDDSSVSTSMRMMQAGAHECMPATLESGALVERLLDLARRHGKTRGLLAAPPPQMRSTQAEIPPMHDLVLPMWRQEQRIIEQAIQSFAGNVALAAAALELSPSTIYRKRQAWAEMDAKRA